MLSCVAMAGLAEAALAFALLIAWIGLALVAGGCALGWVCKSRTIVIVTLFVFIVHTLLFFPWGLLIPVAKPDSVDPDVYRWNARFKVLAMGWIVVTVGLAACIARVARVSARSTNDRRTLSDEERAPID